MLAPQPRDAATFLLSIVAAGALPAVAVVRARCPQRAPQTEGNKGATESPFESAPLPCSTSYLDHSCHCSADALSRQVFMQSSRPIHPRDLGRATPLYSGSGELSLSRTVPRVGQLREGEGRSNRNGFSAAGLWTRSVSPSTHIARTTSSCCPLQHLQYCSLFLHHGGTFPDKALGSTSTRVWHARQMAQEACDAVRRDMGASHGQQRLELGRRRRANTRTRCTRGENRRGNGEGTGWATGKAQGGTPAGKVTGAHPRERRHVVQGNF